MSIHNNTQSKLTAFAGRAFRRYSWRGVLSAFLITLILVALLYSFAHHWEPYGRILELFIGVLAVMTAIIFAIRQEVQLSSLRKIDDETQNIATKTLDIAQKIDTDTHLREFRSKFFSLKLPNEKKFRCFYPVYDVGKPLPSTVAGDYLALQVLTKLLDNSLIPHPCPAPNSVIATAFQNNQFGGLGELQMLSNTDDNEEWIYLCAPQANLALAKLLPAIEIKVDKRDNDLKPGDLGNLGQGPLPCWFGDDYRPDKRAPDDRRGRPTRTSAQLLDQSLTTLVTIDTDKIDIAVSPAEYKYVKAYNKEPQEPQKKVPDYGIFMRLKHFSGRRIYVMAGLHQYGTWIIADYFEKLARGHADVSIRKYSDVYHSPNDFIAVIYGEFDETSLVVTRREVDTKRFWSREDKQGIWDRLT